MFEEMKKINAIHICKLCGVKISTFWNEDEKIFDGHFMSLDSSISEVFKVFQPRMTQIVCMNCFINNRHMKG